MKSSDTLKQIAPALLAAQKVMGDAKKGSSNPFFKSTYADLNTIREVCTPILNEVGVVLLQPTVIIDGKNYVETMLVHASSGEFVSAQTEIKNAKGTAQDEGSGISYARRYSLQSLLNIGAVDDDGEGVMVRETKTETKTPTVTKSSFKKSTPVLGTAAASEIVATSKTVPQTTVTVGDDW